MVKVRDDFPKTIEGSIDIAQWVDHLVLDRKNLDRQLIQSAAEEALSHGANILTPYQSSCFRRGLSIAEILRGLEPDQSTLIAAILYPSVLFNCISIDHVRKTFGREVAVLIEGVIHVDHTHTKKGQISKERDYPFVADSADNLRKMLLAVIEDIRVVLIKLAERIEALQNASKFEAKIRKEIALEAQDIYAPLANRLGIGQIKWELEDLAFRALEPEAYKQIAKSLDEKRLNREEYIRGLIHLIESSMKQEGLEAEVTGRVKHIYSIWRKMQKKRLDFSEIYDVRAVRILVPKVRDCYAALGVVHSLWQHIHKEFDDYIATPKENGYQSLHTAVIGPEGKVVEIQIRTYDMHQESELGVAAHWIYKEGFSQDAQYHAKLNAIRNLLEEGKDLNDTSEYHKLLNSEFHDERVYVFSPMGDVIDLPLGSTPIDFAFEIHTELGFRCRGAKVNGAMVPLTYALKSGDQVEVMALKQGAPSRDWANLNLGYLKSSKAISKVHAWFRKQDRDQHLEQGKEIFEREIKRFGLEKSNLAKITAKLEFATPDDMFAALGSGDLKVAQILNIVTPLRNQKQDEQLHVTQSKQIKDSNIQIQGVGNLLCTFAKCCKPVPGDSIVGYVTVGRGVSIHRKDCMTVHEGHLEQRLIHVAWGGGAKSVFPVDVEIFAYDRHDLLRDITSILSLEKIQVSSVHSTLNSNDNVVKIAMTMLVNNIELLGRILHKVIQLPNVIEAKRVFRKE